MQITKPVGAEQHQAKCGTVPGVWGPGLSPGPTKGLHETHHRLGDLDQEFFYAEAVRRLRQ